MTVGFEITQGDYLAFQMHYMRNDAAYKAGLRRIRFSIPLLVLALLLCFILITDSRSFNLKDVLLSILPVSVVCAIWVLILPGMLRRNIKAKTSQIFKSADNRFMFGHRTMTFRPDGFDVETEVTRQSMVWQGVIKWGETDERLFLYTSALNAYIIPKGMLGAGETEELRSLLTDKVPVKAVKN